MTPPDRTPEPLSREEETAGFDTGTPEWETPPEADEDYLTPREWEAHVARLNEYAAMMPAEGWGWVTPRPGGRPATLEAAGQVIAHGIAFPAAEYLGLCDPTTIRRLIADRPLDAARDSRPVGEGLREALVDGDHEAGGDCARFNPHEHTGATAIRWLALPVLECAEELMGRTRCPAVQCCEPSIPPFGCHDCGHLFDAPCCCVNDPHKGANR